MLERLLEKALGFVAILGYHRAAAGQQPLHERGVADRDPALELLERRARSFRLVEPQRGIHDLGSGDGEGRDEVAGSIWS